MENVKFKKVNIIDQKGRSITVKMMPVVIDLTGSILVCEKCSYKDICMDIKDPTRDPGDEEEDTCLSDLCQDLAKTAMSIEDQKLSDNRALSFIPMKGAFEEAFPNIKDKFRTLLNSSKLVYVDEIVEKVCPGWCSSYTKSHEHCNESNQLCILKKLFYENN